MKKKEMWWVWVVLTIYRSPWAMLFLGATISHFAWAINWMLPFSQGAAMLRGGFNAFWIMAYIMFLPVLGILMWNIYLKIRKDVKNEK